MTRTLVIGLDGATFSIIDHFVRDGLMPSLQSLMTNGVRAKLKSVVPPVTFPAWTSLATGRTPSNHGILDFNKIEETSSGMHIKPYSARDIQCETIWSIASREGHRLICLNYPVMFPGMHLNGFLIPGFVAAKHLKSAIYPESLYAELKTIQGFDIKLLAWDMESEQRVVQTVPDEFFEDFITTHLKRQDQWFDVLHYLMRQYPADLAFYVDDGVDKLQHLAWALLDPALASPNPSDWEKRVRELCREYFRQLDQSIARTIALAGDDTNIFIFSDHGFGASHEIFYLNVWLHRQGFLTWGEAGQSIDDSGDLFNQSRKGQLIDLQRTSVYALTPSSNGLRIRVANHPDQPGIPPDEYLAFRADLAQRLLKVIDPISGEAVVKRVMTREEAYPGRFVEDAPDLTLELRDSGFISVLNSNSILKSRLRVVGTHRPLGVLMGAGPHIRQGIELDTLSITDVCPLLLYSLGLDIPDDLEGRLPIEAFDPNFAAAYPPRFVAAEAPPMQEDGVHTLTKDEEEELLAHFRALGYIE